MLAHAINNVLSDSSRYETDVYYPLGTGSLFRTALRSETVRRCCALPYRNIASGSLKTLIVLLYSLPTILWLIAVCLFRKTDRIYVNSAVVADSRYPRDGRFIEEIGTYDPTKDPAAVNIDAEKAKKWISNGAQPTDTVKALLKKNGVL